MFNPAGCCSPWQPNPPKKQSIVSKLRKKLLAALSYIIPVSFLKKFRKWNGIIRFPKIRKVFPTILANNIVAIQPMDKPLGLKFVLEFVKKRERKNRRNENDLFYKRHTFWAREHHKVFQQTVQGRKGNGRKSSGKLEHSCF